MIQPVNKINNTTSSRMYPRVLVLQVHTDSFRSRSMIKKDTWRSKVLYKVIVSDDTSMYFGFQDSRLCKKS